MAKTERSHYARRYLLHTMLSTDSRNIAFIRVNLEPREICRTESAGQKKTGPVVRLGWLAPARQFCTLQREKRLCIMTFNSRCPFYTLEEQDLAGMSL